MTPDTQKIVLANTTPRYRRLEELWQWVEGSQYGGKPNWWDDSVPRWERAPCIVYPVVQIAIESNVDLVFGEGRFPTFSSKQGEDDTDEEGGADEDDSADVDRFLQKYHRACSFKAHSREAFAHGQGVGTAVGLHGARNGKPYAELVEAKACTPKFNLDGEVESLEIKYPYVEEYLDPQSRQWKERVLFYRRTIDAKADTTYLPGDANANGVEPNWRADPKQTYEHGLGFCPAIWYPFMRGCVPVNVIDGKAIHRLLLDEIHQHDIAVSSRHTTALYSEPQIVEIGVVPGTSPTDSGRAPMMASSERGGVNLEEAKRTGQINGAYGNPSNSAPRKKGPGYPWQYVDPNTKVQYLTISADILKAQDDNARDILTKVQDGLGVVFIDMQHLKLSGTTSGKALEAIRQRQIDRCDQFRDDLWDRFLLPTLRMQLRIAASLGSSLHVPGADKVQAQLQKLANASDDAVKNAVRAA